MSWSSGSAILYSIIESLKDHVEDFDIRYSLYVDLITIFDAEDCDTIYECRGSDKAFDKAYAELFPEEDEDEEEDYEELDFDD